MLIYVVTEPTILSGVNKTRMRCHKRMFDAKIHGFVKHDEKMKARYICIIGTPWHDQLKK